MIEKLHNISIPAKAIVGLVVGAIVLIFFWEPTMAYGEAIFAKAKVIFSK